MKKSCQIIKKTRTSFRVLEVEIMSYLSLNFIVDYTPEQKSEISMATFSLEYYIKNTTLPITCSFIDNIPEQILSMVDDKRVSLLRQKKTIITGVNDQVDIKVSCLAGMTKPFVYLDSNIIILESYLPRLYFPGLPPLFYCNLFEYDAIRTAENKKSWSLNDLYSASIIYRNDNFKISPESIDKIKSFLSSPEMTQRLNRMISTYINWSPHIFISTSYKNMCVDEKNISYVSDEIDKSVVVPEVADKVGVSQPVMGICFSESPYEKLMSSPIYPKLAAAVTSTQKP